MSFFLGQVKFNISLECLTIIMNRKLLLTEGAMVVLKSAEKKAGREGTEFVTA